jgi:Tfp pilus assembly protein PilF
LVGSESKRVTDDNLYLEYAIPRNMFQAGQLFTPSRFRDFLSNPQLAMSHAPDSLVKAAGDYQHAHMMTLEVLNGLAPRSTSPGSPFRKALELAPASALVRKELGHDLNAAGLEALQQGDVQTAQEMFEEAADVSDKAESAISLNNLGYLAYASARRDSAKAYWQKAQQCEPMHPDVAFNLGILYTAENDFENAAVQYEIALSSDPDNSNVLNNFAYSLGQSDLRLDEAVTYAKRAVELERTSNTLDTLGWVQSKNKNWTGAMVSLEEAVALDSNSGEAWLHLAEAQIGGGQTTTARASLQRAVEFGDPQIKARAQGLLESL